MVDTPHYPITVWPHVVRWGAIITGAVAVAAAGGVAWDLFRHPDWQVSMAFFAAVAVAMLGCALHFLGVRYTFLADRLIRRTLFTRRDIVRSGIRGGRHGELDAYLELEMNDGKSIRIEHELLDRCPEWFDGIVDLDDQEACEALDRVSRDERLGKTPQARVARAKLHQRIAEVFFYSALPLLFWTLGPWLPLWLAVLPALLLPFLVFAAELFSRGGIRIGWLGDKGEVRPSLFLSLVYPAFLLPLKMWHYGHRLDVVPFCEWAAVLAVVLAGYAMLRSRLDRRQPLAWAGSLVLAFTYSLGALAAVDVAFDTAPPQSYAVLVRDLDRSTTTYFVEIGSWSPLRLDSTQPVDKDLYVRLRKGGRVCVLVHPGLLGLRWYELAVCRP
jgi:hypothetical protein